MLFKKVFRHLSAPCLFLQYQYKGGKDGKKSDKKKKKKAKDSDAEEDDDEAKEEDKLNEKEVESSTEGATKTLSRQSTTEEERYVYFFLLLDDVKVSDQTVIRTFSLNFIICYAGLLFTCLLLSLSLWWLSVGVFEELFGVKHLFARNVNCGLK